MEETAEMVGEREWKAARKKYDNDARFRAMALMSVARAMDNHGPIDPERVEAAAHNIALEACVLALSQAFDNDMELTEARAMIEKLKGLVLEAAYLRPIAIDRFAPNSRTPPA